MKTEIELKQFPFEVIRLAPNPRSRESIAEKDSLDMAYSILEHGIVVPLLARMTEDGVPEVYAGQRRFVGFELARKLKDEGADAKVDLALMPLLIRDIDDRTMREHQWIENLQRLGVHPRDESRGYHELIDDYGYTPAEVARRIGKSAMYVLGRLTLLQVPEVAWTAYDEERVQVTHLELIGSIPHEKDREEFARRVIGGGRHGERAMPVLEAAALKSGDYVKSLRACGFDKADAELVPVEHKGDRRIMGGACDGCPYRAGTAKALVCTNVRCFRAKQSAAWRATKVNAAENGRRVMDVDQTGGLFDEDTGELLEAGEFVDLAGRPRHAETGHFNEDDMPPWSDLLGELMMEAERLAITARHPQTSRVVLLLEREEAIRLACEADAAHEALFAKRPAARRPKAAKASGGDERDDAGAWSGEMAEGADAEDDDPPAAVESVATEANLDLRAMLPLVSTAARQLEVDDDVGWAFELMAEDMIERLPMVAMRLMLAARGAATLDESEPWPRDAAMRMLEGERLEPVEMCLLSQITMCVLRGDESTMRRLGEMQSEGVAPRKHTSEAAGRKAGITPEIKAAARALYDEGKGKGEIAKALGISENTVGNWQKREWPKRKAKQKRGK